MKHKGIYVVAMTSGDAASSHLAVRFQQAARTFRDSVAIRHDGVSMSYGELACRVNSLTTALRAGGITRGSLVGICLERTPDLIIALLAVLQAGAAYVPLDPSYPEVRLRQVAESAGLDALIDDDDTRPSVSWFTGKRIHARSVAPATKAGAEAEEPKVTSSDLAYVIYTSGSTGAPKGVMVTHHNVCRLYDRTSHWFHFSDKDVWTLFHSVSFDFSVWEIFGALLHGGTLVIVPYWISRAPDLFTELLVSEQVTVLNQTPSAFRLLLGEAGVPGTDLPAALRLIIFGGEVLPQSAINEWVGYFADAGPRLVNMYGITETTVHVTYYDIPLVVLDPSFTVPIGESIPDLSLLILNVDGEPVADGEVGELYVGGPGLARGYLGNPELTRQRFVAVEGGSRLYRTGDLARRTAGALRIEGRNDNQAKVRGFRVDLTEVAGVLKTCAPAYDWVALPNRAASGLFAFYVAQAGQPTLPAADILRAVSSRLPRHAVPAKLIALTALPLTANGKLDQQALQDLIDRPAANESDSGEYSTLNETERVVAAAFRDVLNLSAPGAHESFFELGGDSMRAVKLRALLMAGGFDLSLAEIFSSPTIAGIAARVRPAHPEKGGYERFSLLTDAERLSLPLGLHDAYPSSALQAGMIFHALQTGTNQYYRNYTTVHVKVTVDTEAMRRAVDLLTAAEPALRSSFDLTNPGRPIQRVHASVPSAYETHDWGALQEEDREPAIRRFLEEHAEAGIDCTVPPLFRVVLHRLGDDEMQVTLFEHHAILDGWSVSQLLARLFHEYCVQIGLAAPAAHMKRQVDIPVRTEEDLRPASTDFWKRQLESFEPSFVQRFY